MRIRRFSTAAERLLSLIPGDVGRPITYLRNVMSSRDIEQLASDAMAQVSTREQRVRCIDGAWYAMKMVPYLTPDHAIRGLILELMRTESPAAAAAGDDPVPPFTQQLLTALPYPVMLLDKQLRLAWANRTFLETFGVGPGALGPPSLRRGAAPPTRPSSGASSTSSCLDARLGT